MHLDRCKRLRQPDVRKKLLARIMGKAYAKPEVGNYTFDQDFGRRELRNMIILHEYPLSIVDHVGIRRYSSALQPLFKIPTQNTVKNDIINIYEREREQVMKLLEGIRSRVAVTTNLWTSGNQKKGFMAVTGHFIDEEFILQGRILRSLDFDILAWWRTNGLKYPTLQMMAKDILVVPISTVASEASFSTSGRLVAVLFSQNARSEIGLATMSLKGNFLPSIKIMLHLSQTLQDWSMVERKRGNVKDEFVHKGVKVYLVQEKMD
ncbi:hypothetical protein RJ639_040314 [Escallonia herrerae]|uniref:HAT C-terminal dimerisation domain-containing protein n=1 Tax=Escallonia herrerae TaxID=1293975 RepID=A0AA89B2T4_9ASTE|nr:hypothetical protein RJ639_040314 [Escallonia herrerae]